jgi:hypothetical protein
MKASFILPVLVAFILAPAAVWADPLLSFEGVLADDSGAPLTDTVVMTFAVYGDAVGGEPLWTEVHPEVDVVDGAFFVDLGEIEPFGRVLQTESNLYISLTVDEGGEELEPRNRLHDVPRAAAALWAADVTGQDIHPPQRHGGRRRSDRREWSVARCGRHAGGAGTRRSTG